MIILHPDHLISATVVADATSCQRRAVLQERLKVTGDLNKPQVFGQILHEVFQEIMKVNVWDLGFLRPMIENIVVRYVESLYTTRVGHSDAIEYVMSKMPTLKAWADVFLGAKPKVRYYYRHPDSS
jgi:DNA replication ATP-dependent helicase Dna2